MKVNFFKEDCNYDFGNGKEAIKVIAIIAKEENKKFNQINVIFTSDEYLKDINISFLNHDYYTDVITFPYTDKEISGDIFISVERVSDNSKKFNVSENEELNRVIIHGILHLCGYEDNTDENRNYMRKLENYYLNFFA